MHQSSRTPHSSARGDIARQGFHIVGQQDITWTGRCPAIIRIESSMHPRYGPVLFGFLLSGLMSLIVSGIATVRVTGLADGVFGLWMTSWLSAWVVAFPTVLIVAPLVRRIVAKVVRQDAPPH